MAFCLYQSPRKNGRKEMRNERDLAKGPRRGHRIKHYLEHGPILEDMLFITHHAVLIQCWNPLLCIFHNLGRKEILSSLLEVKAQIWEIN